ncbi:MAG: glycosyltransferase [Devosia sp.]
MTETSTWTAKFQLASRRLKQEIALLPFRGAEKLASVLGYSLKASFTVLRFITAPLWLIAYLPYAILQMRDADTTRVVGTAPLEVGKKRAVVVIPDWQKCGSTEVFASQIRGLAEDGWHVDLAIFTTHWVKRPPDVELFTADTLERAKSLLPLHLVKRTFVLHLRSGWRRLQWGVGASRMTPFARNCNAYSFMRLSLKAFADFCNGADLLISNRVTYLNYLPRTSRIFLETHDVMTGTQEYLNSRDRQGDIALELRLASRADAIGCFSSGDQSFYRRAGRVVIRSPLSMGSPKLTAATSDRHYAASLLYVGDAHLQNLRSLQESVVQVPADLELKIAGRVDRLLRDGTPLSDNVVLLGFVPSLDTLMSAADIIVVPDFYGTGISIKMIEAALSGKPLFATRRALRGLEDVEAAFPRVAIAPDDPSEFFPALRERLEEVKRANWLAVQGAAANGARRESAVEWAMRVSLALSERSARLEGKAVEEAR